MPLKSHNSPVGKKISKFSLAFGDRKIPSVKIAPPEDYNKFPPGLELELG